MTLRRDFLAFTAGAVVSKTILPLAAKAAEGHPDADLIALCAEHIANRDAFNASRLDTETDQDPLWLAYERTRNAISRATPSTLDGMRAKALAAKAEATMPSGREVFDGGRPAAWAWDLVNDLVSGRVA